MEVSKTEYMKFVGVMLGIIAATAFICRVTSDQQGIEHFLRIFMGVFSLTFAAFKFVGYNMFTMMFRQYDVVAKRLPAYANIYPFLQAGIGLLFLLDLAPGIREVAMMMFAGVASIGVITELYKRNAGKVYCACLGNVIKLPLSTVSFVEDAGMFLLSAYMLVMFV